MCITRGLHGIYRGSRYLQIWIYLQVTQKSRAQLKWYENHMGHMIWRCFRQVHTDLSLHCEDFHNFERQFKIDSLINFWWTLIIPGEGIVSRDDGLPRGVLRSRILKMEKYFSGLKVRSSALSKGWSQIFTSIYNYYITLTISHWQYLNHNNLYIIVSILTDIIFSHYMVVPKMPLEILGHTICIWTIWYGLYATLMVSSQLEVSELIYARLKGFELLF